MKRNKLISILILISLTLTLLLTASGCVSLQTADPQITVQGGDTYNVTVDSPPASTVAAASKALMSAVSVAAAFPSGFSAAYSRGSGVIYKMNEEKTEAYVVTNHHVVYSAEGGISESIRVYLYGQEVNECAIAAEYVGGSMYYDLAVLKIKNSAVLMKSEATAAHFADSDTLQVLDTVIAVGNASGNGISATVGHLNVDSEYITLTAADDKTEITLRVMRTDAAVNPGNSGGGLFNSSGEVVGIVNAKSADDSIDNIGYAIPSNVAKSIVENILYYCDGTDKTCVYRCMLGITVTSENPSADYDEKTGTISRREDVVISEISSTSAVKGKFRVGDILKEVTVGGKTQVIDRRHQLIDCMLLAREGIEISFKVLRGGEELTITVTTTADMLEEYV